MNDLSPQEPAGRPAFEPGLAASPDSGLDAVPGAEAGLNPSADEVFDIQHDPFPEEDQGEARRTPHLGHALLFFALTAVIFVICLLLLAVALKMAGVSGTRLGSDAKNSLQTAVSLGVEAAAYVLTLAAAFGLFPLVWKKSFLDGLHWNGLAAKRNWPRLVSAGVLLSVLVQAAEHLVTEPTKPEIEEFMKTPAGAWGVMLLGTLLAPLFEEIAFRGFLLPALATAYDWLSLERTPAGLRRWTTTTAHTMPAMIFGALFSSLLFALAHGKQLDWTLGPVGLLFGVSMVLAWVRVRTHSVACSVVVHLTYNLTIFLAALVATGGFRHLERL